MDYMAYGAYHTRSDNRGTWQRFIFPHVTVGDRWLRLCDGKVLKVFQFAGELYVIQAFEFPAAAGKCTWKCRKFSKIYAGYDAAVVASIETRRKSLSYGK